MMPLQPNRLADGQASKQGQDHPADRCERRGFAGLLQRYGVGLEAGHKHQQDHADVG